jgi:hypothetical protein
LRDRKAGYKHCFNRNYNLLTLEIFMKKMSICFALIMMGLGSSATASMLTKGATQAGSHLREINGHTFTTQRSNSDFNVTKSHFNGHDINLSWYNGHGNLGLDFDHNFIEGKIHPWSASDEHGNRCETIPPISAVPVPAAIWLFGSALMGLVGLISSNRGSKALTA